MTENRIRILGTGWLVAAVGMPAFPGPSLPEVVIPDFAPCFIAGMAMFLLRRDPRDWPSWLRLLGCWLVSLQRVDIRALDPAAQPPGESRLQAFADRCATQIQSEYDVTEPNPVARVVQAERRGEYATVSVITPGSRAMCFHDHDGMQRDASIRMVPVSAVKLGGTGVDLLSWPQLKIGEGYCRLMSGQVGSQVVGVDIAVRVRSGDRARTVRTTVEDGYFLAWYPERLEESGTNTTSRTLRLATGGTVEGLSARDLMEAPV